LLDNYSIAINKGRATSGAALALLGKAYLYDEKYESSCRFVIATGVPFGKSTDLTHSKLVLV
jgi:hypothetical protein